MKFRKFIKENKEVLQDAPVITESIEDLDKQCEVCGTLLNDMGTCPKCDDGEESHAEEDKLEEKLQGSHEDISFLANEFDDALKAEKFNYEIEMRDGFKINIKSEQFEDIKKFADEFFKKWNLAVDVEDEQDDTHNIMLKKANVVVQEELSNMEKLVAAFPELAEENVVTEAVEELSNIEKLQRAFPELDLETTVTEDVEQEWDEYDDNYEFDDDVEQDRVHAALYGGDRMYCDCGAKLVMDEWGSYCPECDAEEAEKKRIDDCCEFEESVDCCTDVDDDATDLIVEQILARDAAIEAAKKLLEKIPDCEGVCYGIDRKKGGVEFFTPYCVTHEEAERIAKTEKFVYVLWNKN